MNAYLAREYPPLPPIVTTTSDYGYASVGEPRGCYETFSSREFSFKFSEPKPLPDGVHICPRCSGSRSENDGWMSIGQTEIKGRAPSPCILCRGSGKVRIEPYEDES